MPANKTNPIQAIKDATQSAFPGLKHLVPDLTAEFKREFTQGSMEIAALLFGGNGFVQYGPGQHAPDVDRVQDVAHDLQNENEGMER